MTSALAREGVQRRYRMARRPQVSIQPCAPRPERRDCHGRLIAAVIGLAGELCEIESASQRPWCSATFVGAQHRMVVKVIGARAAERASILAAKLPDAEFEIANHVVVDMAVDAIDVDGDEVVRVTLAALTIEDW